MVLSLMGVTTLVGLALKEQVLLQGHHVPTDSTDWRLDCLLIGDGRVLRAPEPPASPHPSSTMDAMNMFPRLSVHTLDQRDIISL